LRHDAARSEREEPAFDAIELPAPRPRETVALTKSPLAQVVAEAAELAAQGRPLAAFGLIERELAHEGGHAPVGIRASLLAEAAVILWLLGRYEESEARARRGLALAELAGDAALAADALVRLGLALYRRGQLDGAREAYEEAGARFRRLGDAHKAGAVSNNLGLVCKDKGEWEAARTYYESAVAVARRQAPPGVLGTRLLNLGVLELRMGLWQRADVTLAEARVLFVEAQDRRCMVLNGVARGLLERMRHHLPEALALGQEALALALTERLPREEALSCELLGDVALEGDLRAARTHYERALRIADRIGPAPDLECEVLRRLAAVAVREGDSARSLRLLERARSIASKLGNPYEAALLEAVDAERLLAIGETDAALEQLNNVVGVLAELGERYERGRVLARLARLTGTPEDAVRLAFRASACFAEAGAETELHEIGEEISRRIAGATALPPSAPKRAAATPSAGHAKPALIGPSRAIARVRVRISRVARHEYPVLLRGEKGVGKDLVARLLHERSRAKDGPFIAVRCGDFDQERLFAHVFGEGAARGRTVVGALERAHGGTLYLDRIEHLPWPVQSGILRVLERGTFCRVGELEPREVRARILASIDVLHDVEPLRTELKARFARGTIDIPALRDRRDDIVPIARAFLAESGIVPPPRLSAEAAELLIAEPWFGNVRELHECVGQVLAEIGPETALIGPDVLAPLLVSMTRTAPAQPQALPEESTALKARLREVERQRILRSLSRAHGNKTAAARELEIARKTLYERMKRLGIALDD
jgi:two-component system response regulator AtoC